MREPIDLASEVLRGFVLGASNDPFGKRGNLLKSNSASDREDGWLTSRKRSGDFDWAVVRLGVPGTVEEVIVDTSHFSGDYPAEVKIEGCVAAHNSRLEELSDWVTLVPCSGLKGNRENCFESHSKGRYTHLRMSIFPDGGIARLRVLGQPVPNWMAPGHPAGGQMDLAATINGGHVHSASNSHFGDRLNLIMPGLSGCWMTGRRREPGHDWAIVRLVGPGRIESLILDTAQLLEDCPQQASVEASAVQDPGPDDWFTLLPPQNMIPNTEHQFRSELEENSDLVWLRLNLLPDGGMTRLRALGTLNESGLEEARLLYLNASQDQVLGSIFKQVCHSDRFVQEMVRSKPFFSLNDLLKKGAGAWSKCTETDWKQALDGHPRIGEKAKGSDLSARWSKGEQSNAAAPQATVVEQLKSEQEAYFQKFGFIFLICASGKSSEEILKSVQTRLNNSAQEELQIVAEEQAKIIHLRLEKLLKS